MCEPSKLYRSHAPRPCKRGRGRKSSDPTASRRTPLSMLSRPFCFPTSSRTRLSVPDNSRAIPRIFLSASHFFFFLFRPNAHNFVLLSFLFTERIKIDHFFPSPFRIILIDEEKSLAKPREIGSFVERVKINYFILL